MALLNQAPVTDYFSLPRALPLADSTPNASSSNASLVLSPPGSPYVGRLPPVTPGTPGGSLRKRSPSDFIFGDNLGDGAYSSVVKATDRETGNVFAAKILDKRHIVKNRKVKYVNVEKAVLNLLGGHPFIVRLYYTFQDEGSLYFILDLAVNGDLLGFLKKFGTFSEDVARWYAAELVEAVEYMHGRGVIHRDIKPEVSFRRCRACEARRKQTLRWLSLRSFASKREGQGWLLPDALRAAKRMTPSDKVEPKLARRENFLIPTSSVNFYSRSGTSSQSSGARDLVSESRDISFDFV